MVIARKSGKSLKLLDLTKRNNESKDDTLELPKEDLAGERHPDTSPTILVERQHFVQVSGGHVAPDLSL